MKKSLLFSSSPPKERKYEENGGESIPLSLQSSFLGIEKREKRKEYWKKIRS